MTVPSISTPLDPTNMSAGTTTYYYPGAQSASYSSGMNAVGQNTGNFNVNYGNQGQGYGNLGSLGGLLNGSLTPAQQKAGAAADAAALAGKPINYASLTPQQSLPVLMNANEFAYNDAKQTNLDRYNSIDAGFKQRQSDIASQEASLPANYGAGEQAVLDQNYAEQKASTDQNAANLGMSNTTVMPSLDAGVLRQHELASGALQDQIAMSRAQLQQQAVQTNAQASADTLNFENSRQDPYPDSGQMTQIAQMYGQGSLQYLQALAQLSGGGMGGGGYGGGGGGGSPAIGGSAYGGYANSGFGLPQFYDYSYGGGSGSGSQGGGNSIMPGSSSSVLTSPQQQQQQIQQAMQQALNPAGPGANLPPGAIIV